MGSVANAMQRTITKNSAVGELHVLLVQQLAVERIPSPLRCGHLTESQVGPLLHGVTHSTHVLLTPLHSQRTAYSSTPLAPPIALGQPALSRSHCCEFHKKAKKGQPARMDELARVNTHTHTHTHDLGTLSQKCQTVKDVNDWISCQKISSEIGFVCTSACMLEGVYGLHSGVELNARTAWCAPL